MAESQGNTAWIGSVTITTDVGPNCATTSSRMNLSGYEEYVTVFSWIMNAHYCVLFRSRVRVRIRVWIRFTVWLVICYAHVFIVLSIVIVTLSLESAYYHFCKASTKRWTQTPNRRRCQKYWKYEFNHIPICSIAKGALKITAATAPTWSDVAW